MTPFGATASIQIDREAINIGMLHRAEDENIGASTFSDTA
jgi:hypothetical protein